MPRQEADPTSLAADAQIMSDLAEELVHACRNPKTTDTCHENIHKEALPTAMHREAKTSYEL